MLEYYTLVPFQVRALNGNGDWNFLINNNLRRYFRDLGQGKHCNLMFSLGHIAQVRHFYALVKNENCEIAFE